MNFDEHKVSGKVSFAAFRCPPMTRSVDPRPWSNLDLLVWRFLLQAEGLKMLLHRSAGPQLNFPDPSVASEAGSKLHRPFFQKVKIRLV